MTSSCPATPAGGSEAPLATEVSQGRGREGAALEAVQLPAAFGNSVTAWRSAAAAKRPGSVQALDDHRHPLPAADTHGLQPVRLVERLEVVEQGAEDPGAGHAEGVAQRDRPSVRVQLVAVGVDA